MKECIILGGGTSLLELEHNWDKIKGKDIWALNSSWKIMPYLPSRVIWVDKSFFNNSYHELLKLHERGVKLYTREPNDATLYKGRDSIVTILKASRFVEQYENNEIRLFLGQLGLCGVFALSLA